MNILDLILLVLILILGIWGTSKGLVRMIAMAISIFVGSIVAVRFYPSIQNLIDVFVGNGQLSKYLSMIIVFIGFAFLVSLLAKLIQKFIKAVELAWLNRLGGFAAGCVIGFIISSLIIIFLTVWLPPDNSYLNKSVLYPVWVDTVEKAKPLIPACYRENFSSNYVRFVELTKTTKENITTAKKVSDFIPKEQENVTNK